MAPKLELPLTQPSTLVAIICTLLVAVAATFGLDLGGDRKELMEGLLKLVHLGSFSTWLGVQVWVTFFAGKNVFIRYQGILLKDDRFRVASFHVSCHLC